MTPFKVTTDTLLLVIHLLVDATSRQVSNRSFGVRFFKIVFAWRGQLRK